MLRIPALSNTFLIAGACLLAGAAQAAGQSGEDGGYKTRVEVNASVDYGELPYRYFVAGQRQ